MDRFGPLLDHANSPEPQGVALRPPDAARDRSISAVSSTGSTACGDACTHQNALDAWCLLAKVAPNDANARLKPLVCRETKSQTGLALISPAQPSPHDKRVSSRVSRGRSERRSLTYPLHIAVLGLIHTCKGIRGEGGCSASGGGGEGGGRRTRARPLTKTHL